jgi:hypothetical protein
MSQIVLPTSPIAPSRKDPRLLVLYGEPKVGKTTAIAKLPVPYCIIDTHNGTDYVESFHVKINNLEEYEQTCNLLRLKNKPYKVVVLDVIDQIEEWCVHSAKLAYRATILGKNFPMSDNILDLPNGAGYKWLRSEFNRCLALLANTADKTIIVAHVKEKYLDNMKAQDGTKLEGVVNSRDLDLTGKCRNILFSVANAMGFVYREKDKLMVSFVAGQELSAGTHCSHLAGQRFEFDWSKIYIE